MGEDVSVICGNIATGQVTLEDVVKGWIDSPGYRVSILNERVIELGAGYVEDGYYETYWT